MRAGETPGRSQRLLRRPAAVVFDMDGLMLDTEGHAAQAWIDAALRLGMDFDRDVTTRLVGRNSRDCMDLIRAHHGPGYPVEALLDAWHTAYEAIIEREGIAVKPGLFELLAWLDAEGIPKAVATSTRKARAQAKLVRTDLAHRFVAIVGGDEIARSKPAPDIYLEAAARLGIPAVECVALEDSEPGIIAALAAGMTAIMVPDVGAPSPALLARGPLVLASLAEAHAHLAALPAAERVR
jgi:HAD superfamily hydrolase (TIGR01509 family)